MVNQFSKEQTDHILGLIKDHTLYIRDYQSENFKITHNLFSEVVKFITEFTFRWRTRALIVYKIYYDNRIKTL